jgi:hypothetical protein
MSFVYPNEQEENLKSLEIFKDYFKAFVSYSEVNDVNKIYTFLVPMYSSLYVPFHLFREFLEKELCVLVDGYIKSHDSYEDFHAHVMILIKCHIPFSDPNRMLYRTLLTLLSPRTVQCSSIRKFNQSRDIMSLIKDMLYIK